MVKNSDPTLCIIGAGRVGLVLAYQFIKANFSLTAIIENGRDKHPDLKVIFPKIAISTSPTAQTIFKSDIVFISVQDDELSEVVMQLERLSEDYSGKTFVHTSGVYSSKILMPLKKRNGLIASAHPIYSFGEVDPAKFSLKGVYADLEGDPAAISRLKILFQNIGMITFEISAQQKSAVHIASVLYSNYFVGLSQIAQDILSAAAVPEENYWKPFLPLIHSTLENLSSATPADALTGPIKRGDVQTIREHLRHLESNLPEVIPTYITMARYILNCSALPDEKKNPLQEILNEYL